MCEVRNQAKVCFFLLTKSFLQLDYYYPYFVFRHFYCYLAKDKLFFLYSQSQIIPLLVSLGELLGPKYLDGNDISVNLKMANWRERSKENRTILPFIATTESGELPWAQTWVSWLLLINYNQTWWAPHGPKCSLAGVRTIHPRDIQSVI